MSSSPAIDIVDGEGRASPNIQSIVIHSTGGDSFRESFGEGPHLYGSPSMASGDPKSSKMMAGLRVEFAKDDIAPHPLEVLAHIPDACRGAGVLLKDEGISLVATHIVDVRAQVGDVANIKGEATWLAVSHSSGPWTQRSSIRMHAIGRTSSSKGWAQGAQGEPRARPWLMLNARGEEHVLDVQHELGVVLWAAVVCCSVCLNSSSAACSLVSNFCI